MKIDIILWDHKILKQIMASPVSERGALALITFMIGHEKVELPKDSVIEKTVGCAPMELHPDEFLAHMPKELVIMFYNEDQEWITDVRFMNKKNLQ